MPAPTVSVVIVTRDRPHLLADALASVAAQHVRPLEVRIADDGGGTSLDFLPVLPLLELSAVAVRFAQAGAARNAAVAGARGEVLAFLDDDDRWRPDHLGPLVAAFADPGVAFAWRDVVVVRERVDEDGVRVDLDRRTIARDWDESLMRSNDYLPPSAWAVRASLFAALDGFDTRLRYSEDWDFLLRARAHLAAPGADPTRAMRRVPGVTVEVRLREHGNTSADFGDERRDCLRRLEARHGLPSLEPKTFWEVAETLGKTHA